MDRAKLKNGVLAPAAAAVVVACGGGSDASGPGPGFSNPALPSTVNVVGTVTGFGSVYVNGVRYAVDGNTVVNLEDEGEVRGDDSALALGMKVFVRAEDTNGARVAQRIEYDDDIEGQIEAILPDGDDPSIGVIVVNGLDITVDGNTVYDDDVGNNDGEPGIDIRDLAVGMVVEISGYPTEGGFLASRVDRELDDDGNDPEVGRPDVDDDEIEIKGFVEAIADDNSSLTVAGVLFLIDAGTEFDDGLLLNDELIGRYVEVEADIVGDDYVAVEIEAEDDFDIDDDGDDDYEDEFEIEGVLQAVDTDSEPNTITINGITIPVRDASAYVGVVGQIVEIEGEFDANGVLVIEDFELDEDENVSTEDNVASIDTDAGSFTTRLGITITPDGGSSVEDYAGNGDGDDLTPAEFISRLQIGDRIDAEGYAGDGGVIWTSVDREATAAFNDEMACELRGPVESIAGDAASFSIDILGVTVLTDMIEEEDFETDDDFSGVGRAEFFAALQVGSIVAAESFDGDMYCMEGTLDAAEIEFDD